MWKLLVVISLVGCGGQSKKDWSGKELVTETLTMDGVTFTLDVPEGLPKSKRDRRDWYDERAGYEHVPKIFTAVWTADSMPKDEESAMLSAALDLANAHFIRKDKRPDGWAMTDASPDRHRISSWTVKKVGADAVIMCTANQVTDGELPSYDKTKAMLEAICDSVKLK